MRTLTPPPLRHPLLKHPYLIFYFIINYKRNQLEPTPAFIPSSLRYVSHDQVNRERISFSLNTFNYNHIHQIYQWVEIELFHIGKFSCFSKKRHIFCPYFASNSCSFSQLSSPSFHLTKYFLPKWFLVTI